MIKTRIISACGYAGRWAKIHLFGDETQREVDRWFRDKGDLTHRLIYPLDSHSTVFDCGGYEGDWTYAIYERYQSKIYVFEPVREFYDRIRHRFRENLKVAVYNFGLHSHNAAVTIRVDKNSSSVFGKKGKVQTVDLVDIDAFVHANCIDHIDLLKINIEGGEYDLLDRILDTGLIRSIADVQIQFHRFVPDADKRRREIRRRLAETHSLTYDYEFVWENWTRNDRRHHRHLNTDAGNPRPA